MKQTLAKIIVDAMLGKFGHINSELVSRLEGLYLEIPEEKKNINPLRVNCYNRLVSKQLKDLADKVNQLVDEINNLKQ